MAQPSVALTNETAMMCQSAGPAPVEVVQLSPASEVAPLHGPGGGSEVQPCLTVHDCPDVAESAAGVSRPPGATGVGADVCGRLVGSGGAAYQGEQDQLGPKARSRDAPAYRGAADPLVAGRLTVDQCWPPSSVWSTTFQPATTPLRGSEKATIGRGPLNAGSSGSVTAPTRCRLAPPSSVRYRTHGSGSLSLLAESSR